MSNVHHFLSLENWTSEKLMELLRLAVLQKADSQSYRNKQVLKNKVIGLVFEYPSMRTRLSFEVAIVNLGGSVIYMGPEAGKLGVRESLKDFAQVGSRYLDGFVIRTTDQAKLEEIARHSSVPVINALSNRFHPCQALGDLLTIQEKCGDLKKVIATYVGDANNVCQSLCWGAALSGMELRVSSPEGYRLMDAFYRRLPAGHKVVLEANPERAASGAQVLYTDVWASMGQEGEADERKRRFHPYQINARLVSSASSQTIVMHCLPAHREEEISSEVIDGPHSVVIDQAENRLHAQRALLSLIYG